MELLDLVPQRGYFRPGEPVEFQVEVGQPQAGAQLRFAVWHMARRLAESTQSLPASSGVTRLPLTWQAPPASPRGYGMRVELLAHSGQVVDSLDSAVDVLADWTQFPRYGFLSDFGPGAADERKTFDVLRKLHLNGLQFYDWMYRHNQLLPPQDEYRDPLERPLSLATVRQRIRAAEQAGLACMAYAAIYAASFRFWRDHPDWALHDADGEPIAFGDEFLGLMDPSPGTAWARHLHQELDQVLAELPFAGVHLDQYGDPKRAYDAAGEDIDLPSAFVEFIRERKRRRPDAPLAFNAVGGWPLERLAQAPLDFQYTELWPPLVEYEQVIDLLLAARGRAPDKGLVVAAYLPTGAAANIHLLQALCFSLGASRIELGEDGRYLVDPYFPKHEPLAPQSLGRSRAYYDFAVRYGELLGPSARTSGPVGGLPSGVIGFSRRAQGWHGLAVLNFSGLSDARWNEIHPWPASAKELSLRLPAPDLPVKGVWWASPDRGEPQLSPCQWSRDGDSLAVTLPYLDLWSLIAIETES